MPDAARRRDEIVNGLSPPTQAAIRKLDMIRAVHGSYTESVGLLIQELDAEIDRLAEALVADDQKRARLVTDALVVAGQGVE